MMMQAGFGKAVLTPPLGTELAGYGYYLGRRATRVRDKLYARAVAFEQDGRRYCVVSCDVLGLSREVVSFVRGHLARRHGCGHAILVSIHTHSGPTIKHHEGTGEVCPAYLATVPAIIAYACEAAFADLAPVAAMRWTMAEVLPHFACNRTGDEPPPDQAARAIRISRENRAPLLLISYACHAVARGRTNEISADYPGEVCMAYDRLGSEAIFLSGVCGDINPPDPHEGDLAMRMAGAIVRAAAQPGIPLPLGIEGGVIREQLRLMRVTEESIQSAADHAARNEAIPGGAKVARIWEKAMLAQLGMLPQTEDFSVYWLRLGGIPIVAFPFETFTLTGALLRGALSDARAMVLGCADELLGYLPTYGDMMKKSYAALESTFLYKRLPALPYEAERLGEAIGNALKTR